MISTKSLLLAGTALLMLTAAAPAAQAESGGPIVLAQAAAPQQEGDKEKAREKGAEKPPHPEAKPQHQPAKPEHAQPKPAEKAPPPQHQAQPKPPESKPTEKPAAQQPPPHEAPKAVQEQPRHQAEPKREEKHQERQKPEAKPNTAAKPAPEGPATKPAASEEKPAEKKPEAQHNETKPAVPNRQPAAQTPTPQKPAAQSTPVTQPPANNAQRNAPTKPIAQTPAPAIAPPQKPQSAQQFILPKNGKPTVTIQDMRKERHEQREGNRTVITEGDRTIVKENNRTIIRHDESRRFAVGARDVNVERRGNETTTVIVRPNGDHIVNVTDERGHLVRRVRRERGGREVVIIDERAAGPRRGIFVELPPPVIHIPRDRYIVELDRARPETIYEVLDAPPVEAVQETYTVDQVRYSAPLRDRMPRLDLDINFDTSSWQMTPDQVDKLNVVAEGLNRAIQRNPREVFLIEGHTDAVGAAEDNLSLSDRRAESVAVALTEQFHVPPENLVTQGYGEQSLKVQTEGAARANRRVSVRRITPLIDKQAAR
ncbi:MAG TPA: OmpA family protein [Pseudolabrys sp.]